MNDIFEREFNKIIIDIDQSHEEIAQGKVPALHDLERRVTALCHGLSQAAPETARKVQPLMGRAIQRLDELEQSLEAFRNRMEG